MKNLKVNQTFLAKILVLMCLLLSVMFTACKPKPMTRDEMISKVNSVRQEVDNLAMRVGSTDDAAKFFTDDYIMMEPNHSPLRGKKAYLQRVDTLLKRGVKINSVKREIINIWQGEGRIYEMGTAVFNVVLPDVGGAAAVVEPTDYFTIWETQADGSMQMQFSIWNTQVDIIVNGGQVGTPTNTPTNNPVQ